MTSAKVLAIARRAGPLQRASSCVASSPLLFACPGRRRPRADVLDVSVVERTASRDHSCVSSLPQSRVALRRTTVGETPCGRCASYPPKLRRSFAPGSCAATFVVSREKPRPIRYDRRLSETGRRQKENICDFVLALSRERSDDRQPAIPAATIEPACKCHRRRRSSRTLINSTPFADAS